MNLKTCSKEKYQRPTWKHAMELKNIKIEIITNILHLLQTGLEVKVQPKSPDIAIRASYKCDLTDKLTS